VKTPTDEEFEKIIGKALDSLPEKYVSKLDNVAIVYEDEPTPEQRKKLKLRCNQTLFGLYEGVPQIRRGTPFAIIPPDKITIFKVPAAQFSQNEEQLFRQVRHTLWHEIAHHFGLQHEQIHDLDGTM
jgi:predicted Zn-dependent protease with MMP-like domain